MVGSGSALTVGVRYRNFGVTGMVDQFTVGEVYFRVTSISERPDLLVRRIRAVVPNIRGPTRQARSL